MLLIQTADVLEIRMQSYDVECGICGEPTDMRHGVPTYNGGIVSNDFPEWLYHNGGGSFPVCQECYAKHERDEIPTCDHYYVPQTLMGVHLVDGGGI